MSFCSESAPLRLYQAAETQKTTLKLLVYPIILNKLSRLNRRRYVRSSEDQLANTSVSLLLWRKEPFSSAQCPKTMLIFLVGIVFLTAQYRSFLRLRGYCQFSRVNCCLEPPELCSFSSAFYLSRLKVEIPLVFFLSYTAPFNKNNKPRNAIMGEWSCENLHFVRNREYVVGKIAVRFCHVSPFVLLQMLLFAPWVNLGQLIFLTVQRNRGRRLCVYLPG